MKKTTKNSLHSVQQFLTKNNIGRNEPPRFVIENEQEMLSILMSFSQQFFYIVRLPDLDLLYMHPGFCSVLGYKDVIEKLDQLYNLIHPDDRSVVIEATRKILFILAQSRIPMENSFYITFRMLNAAGQYVWVQRQTGSFQYDPEGKIITYISIIRDLSCISGKIINEISCHMTGPLYHTFEFPDRELKQYIANRSILTNRELQVLKELFKGKTSHEVGDALFISVHTVDQHRRNMLHKTKTKNTRELLNYAISHNLI